MFSSSAKANVPSNKKKTCTTGRKTPTMFSSSRGRKNHEQNNRSCLEPVSNIFAFSQKRCRTTLIQWAKNTTTSYSSNKNRKKYINCQKHRAIFPLSFKNFAISLRSTKKKDRAKWLDISHKNSTVSSRLAKEKNGTNWLKCAKQSQILHGLEVQERIKRIDETR